MLYFRRGDFDIDNDGSKRGFEELCWVIDGVCIQDDQLERLGQLKDPFYLTLDLSCEETKEKRTSCTRHFKFSSWLDIKKMCHLFLAGINLYLAKKTDQRHLSCHSPRLERVLDLSIMAFLFSTERFANDRSAVTRVIEILQKKHLITSHPQLFHFKGWDQLALSRS